MDGVTSELKSVVMTGEESKPGPETPPVPSSEIVKPKYRPRTNAENEMLRSEALRHRLAGWSISRIAKALNQPRRRVSGWIDTELMLEGARRSKDVEQLRTLELSRIDELLAALWEKATAGGLKHISVALKLIQRRCAILGLDEPEKMEIEASGVEGILAILAEARQRRDRGTVDRLAGLSLPPSPFGLRSVEGN